MEKKLLPFKMDIPSDILDIAKVFKDNGYTILIVGGAVRDSLLNRLPKDFDLVTNALPDVVEIILEYAGFKTLPTGKAFGVINVFTEKNEYEIATFREESYTDVSKRRPNTVEFSNIEADCARRDLTINALYYDIDKCEIIDYVDGITDLNLGIIRTVGNPVDRFNEDKLRILRSIRLAARFDSDLHPDIEAALTADASLEGISAERIRDEFIKGIKSAKSIISFLKLLDKYNLFDWIFKGLIVNKEYKYSKRPEVLIAMLLRDNNVTTLTKVLNNLKYSVEEIHTITFLVSLINLTPENAVKLKRLQNSFGIQRLTIIHFAISLHLNVKLIKAFLSFELTVSGEEVMEQYNLKPSKELGDMIYKLETDKFNSLLK